MTVVPFQPGPPLIRQSSLDVLERVGDLADRIGNTDFVPRGLRGNLPAVAAAILYGHEVGLQPMQSLWSIAVIDGKPTMAAETMRGLILAAGHEIWPEEVTNTRVTMAGRRSDSKTVVRATWTLDDAKRARLAGKPNWQAYPRQMLMARATAELARSVFADVIRGMPATEEAGDLDEQGGPTPVLEPSQPTRRRRRPVASVDPSPPETAPPPPSPGPPPVIQPDEPEPPAEPEPEQEPEPDAKPDPPSREAVGMMFALFTQKGLSERADRLAFTEETLGRTVTSSGEMSALDVSRVIDALQERPDQLPPNEQAILDDLESELGAREVGPEPPQDQIPGTEEPATARLLEPIRVLSSTQGRDPTGYASSVVGRELASLEELTISEATLVLNRLTSADR